MERKRFISIASLALVTSEIVSACSGNNPGDKVIAQELAHGNAKEGRTISTLIIKGRNFDKQQELIGNGGVHVRVGYPSISAAEVGIILPNVKIKAEIIDTGNGEWAATKCDNSEIILDDAYSRILHQSPDLSETICFFDSQDFAIEANK
jgi:hypothetical protein